MKTNIYPIQKMFTKYMQKGDEITAIRGEREAVYREVRKLLNEGWCEISQEDYEAISGSQAFA